ncbi:MAG: threonylcarbamoyl-AMP synthase [Gemmatimonadaceae bacterium]|nr:threonylcarbamoyl-AMP synthase [Gemmatimonadaceae bacterium]
MPIPQQPDAQLLAEAARLLDRGELVAFPTETVYGLGADALNADAVARIFAAKGRPAWNPVIVHVADISAARAVTASWPPSAQRLAEKFWPGPLTLVLPKHARIPDVVSAGLDAVAVRVPAHPVALALLRAFGRPIAAPSANRFTQLSPTTAAHVVNSLGDRVQLIIDGGPCEVGIESTVIDLAGDVPTILRPGVISREQLEQALGATVRIASPPARAGTNDAASAPDVGTPQRSPGMAARHYAPQATVWLLHPGNRDELVDAMTTWNAKGPIVALLRSLSLGQGSPHTVVAMPEEPRDYARALYAALHAADATAASLVIVEQPPDSDAWAGVRDRLTRAAR